MKNRYSQLLHAIDLFKPQTIVEVGTWNGQNAIRMIQQAQKYHKNVVYVGYDLFEDANSTTDTEELNVKAHHTAHGVECDIKKACPAADVQLIKGNTRDTLKNIQADFVFIDGGHSIETISHDYEACKDSNVIIMDDYYVPDGDDRIPDTLKYGCNQLVDMFTCGVVLPLADPVKEGGLTQMVLLVAGER